MNVILFNTQNYLIKIIYEYEFINYLNLVKLN